MVVKRDRGGTYPRCDERATAADCLGVGLMVEWVADSRDPAAIFPN